MNIDLTFLDKIHSVLERIESKKKMLDSKRPLSVNALNRLRDKLTLEWTYNTNAIEGNTLTMNETKVVLETGIAIGGKSLREHFEVINHTKAVTYLESIVSNEGLIRSIDLLKLHELVLKNIDDEFAGRIRNGNVRIVGANFTPANAAKISRLLDELVDFVNLNKTSISIPVLAGIFHHRFVWIHPFFDGNGRTGRLAMNLLLMNHGFPPCIILKNDRQKYYAALNQANGGAYEKISLMVMQGLERSINHYLDFTEGYNYEYLPISDIVKDPEIPYGMEYISLLARRGEIDAQKEGRAWYTTKEAIIGYAKEKGKLN